MCNIGPYTVIAKAAYMRKLRCSHHHHHHHSELGTTAGIGRADMAPHPTKMQFSVSNY